MDNMNRAYFLTIINQRWLGLRLDLVGDTLLFIVAMLVVTSRFSVPPSISGVVLSNCVVVVLTMGLTTRQFAEVENDMNSTERLHSYATTVENEAPLDLPATKPPPSWPEKGEVIIKDVVLRYRHGLPAALKGVSLHIRSGERVGIGMISIDKTEIHSRTYRCGKIVYHGGLIAAS